MMETTPNTICSFAHPQWQLVTDVFIIMKLIILSLSNSGKGELVKYCFAQTLVPNKDILQMKADVIY